MPTISDYFYPQNPVTGRRGFHFIPTFIENFVGASSYAPLIEKSGGEITETHADAKYRRYVRLVKEVGAQLAAKAKRKDLQFEFKVIDSMEDNAWCLPGGKIGIHVGLIQNMEKEGSKFSLKERVAAVLSHEIIHADARHTGRALEFRLFLLAIIKGMQVFFTYRLVSASYNEKIRKAADNRDLVVQLTQERDQKARVVGALFELAASWLINGISLCKSRSHELESDRYGMRLMRDVSGVTGFNSDSPQAAIWLQQFFEKHHSHNTRFKFLNSIRNFFSSHPSPEERLAANQKTWAELKAGKFS